jgi:hypothetical protein
VRRVACRPAAGHPLRVPSSITLRWLGRCVSCGQFAAAQQAPRPRTRSAPRVGPGRSTRTQGSAAARCWVSICSARSFASYQIPGSEPVYSEAYSGRSRACHPSPTPPLRHLGCVESGRLSRMCGNVSFGFTVSLGVTVVSRIRAPGSSAALLEAHPAARVLTSPARSSRLMFTSQSVGLLPTA